MRTPHIPHYDPRDPNCPWDDDYNPDTIWDEYEEECDRRYEERKMEE